ncbi:hypothetical protein [Niabella ginsengisoli]|uniref:DUF4265 domain-containing protein n=1 Tax=Niabella ginsengisoli TaxID=522298 RepID=A0ABS9SLG8_9BACT|nr:hypothetical protein [Niabella ginsengisoli]MCH5599227.1 hypothetical protein [Niabella ginsengisoli]
MFKIAVQFLNEDFVTDSKMDNYKPYFLDHDINKSDISNSGYFEYKHKDGDIVLLFIAHDGKFSLRYDYNILTTTNSSQPSYYSVFDPNHMNEIIDAGDENMIPLGSLVESNQAWAIICDFYQNPEEKSSRIQWLDAEEINWGDIE